MEANGLESYNILQNLNTAAIVTYSVYLKLFLMSIYMCYKKEFKLQIADLLILTNETFVDLVISLITLYSNLDVDF